MTVEELAALGEWTSACDIPRCRVDRCFQKPEHYVKVAIKGKPGEETIYFCGGHFMPYLRARDIIREQEHATK